MTEQELIEKIDTVLADEFEVDRTTITPEAPLLETLDLDSLDLVDVVVIVDKNFGVTLTGPDFKELKTFRDFYDLLSAGRMGNNGKQWSGRSRGGGFGVQFLHPADEGGRNTQRVCLPLAGSRLFHPLRTPRHAGRMVL